MDGKKPHLLKTYNNNLGKQVNIIYRSSVSYYLDDKKSGKEWITRLPFPVHCISKVETIDKLTNSKFTTSYRYRHGYYDHSERRFCGFGYVEQVDVDEFDRESLDQAPVITKTWFHTGAFTSKEKILTAFEKEYFYNQPGINFKEPQLQDAIVDKDLSIEEWREAMFACKGLPLRIEIFADDNSPDKDIPYTSAQHNCIVKKIQPKANNKYAVFMVHETSSSPTPMKGM
jgi:hypothetical protein